MSTQKTTRNTSTGPKRLRFTVLWGNNRRTNTVIDASEASRWLEELRRRRSEYGLDDPDCPVLIDISTFRGRRRRKIQR